MNSPKMILRDYLITGTFAIGDEGLKEPPSWKKYAEDLESKILLLMKQTSDKPDLKELYKNLFGISNESHRVLHVQVISSQKPTYWYNTEINSFFSVIDYNETDYMTVKFYHDGSFRELGMHIEKCDAKIITEKDFIKNE
jgi:hypothetical protein